MCSRTVSLDTHPFALSYWKNTIAVGLLNGDIIILNAITGSQKAVFSGHTDHVKSLTFSSDGTALVSGSNDKTVKLWDVQTGGVVKTFFGHTNLVTSVSISADYTMIASGSFDNTVHLWDIHTGDCHHVIKQQAHVEHVFFSPTDPQYLLSRSDNKIWQWDIHGHQIPPAYDGFFVAFSPDGTQFALCNRTVVTVQNSYSRAIVARLHTASSDRNHCCFSPDGRLVAVAVGYTAYIWDITGSDPYLVETFIGHTNSITSLAFSSPSSLISASSDKSVKFWQIDVSPTYPVETNLRSTPLKSAQIMSITLQAKDGIAISSDPDGVVRIWDISTSVCKASFKTPALNYYYRDVQLIDGILTLVWVIGVNGETHIWDLEKGEDLKTVDASGGDMWDMRISGDGSKIFCLYREYIKAWSIQTGEVVGRVDVKQVDYRHCLTVDGTRVWIHYLQSGYQGWDFGTQGSSPIQLPNGPPDRLYLTHTMLWDVRLPGIKDVVTGNVAFQLSGRFAKPIFVEIDGHYLAAGYSSGEVLILDFGSIFLQ